MKRQKKINILPATLIIVFVVITLINFWIGKESSKTQPVIQEENQEKSTILNQISQLSETSQPLFIGSEITVVKPASKEKLADVIKKETTNDKKPERRLPLPAGKASLTKNSDAGSAPPTLPPAGVTIDSKHATPEQINDMNTRGIIIW